MIALCLRRSFKHCNFFLEMYFLTHGWTSSYFYSSKFQTFGNVIQHFCFKYSYLIKAVGFVICKVQTKILTRIQIFTNK